MISGKMAKALNEQITRELSNTHLYLAMSFCFDQIGLKVFAQRFATQSDEERAHALKIVKYLQDVGAKVSLGSIPEPVNEYPSAHAIVEASLNAEKRVAAEFNELSALAEGESDYATRSFLKWFVDEQVEEVATMAELLQWVNMAGESNLFLLEARLEKLGSDVG